jgi:hypothetical protein
MTVEYPDKYWHCKASPVNGGVSNIAYEWDLTYEEMSAKIIKPCRSRKTFLVDGNIIKSFDDLEELKIAQTELPHETMIANYIASLPQGDMLRFSLHLSLPFDEGVDHTGLALPSEDSSMSIDTTKPGPEIFISHAVTDKALADLFVQFLKEAVGVPGSSIFCSSVGGHGIPFGVDFNDYLKSRISTPRLVILLMTESYMESAFCLMELGAAWANSTTKLPVVVPPVKFDNVTKTLGLTQAWNVENHEGLIDLRDLIKASGVPLESRSDHDWDRKRQDWRADSKRIIKKLPAASKVAIEDHQVVVDALSSAKAEISELEEVLGRARDEIAALEKAKDRDQVKSIRQQFRAAEGPEAKFENLIANVIQSKPAGITSTVFLHMILDYFGNSKPINWFESNADDFRDAMQYNLLAKDEPHSVLWTNTKLTKLKTSLKELTTFLDFPDGQTLKGTLGEDAPIDPTDRAFWEHHLK